MIKQNIKNYKIYNSMKNDREPYIRKSYSRILLHDNLRTNNNDIDIISESTSFTFQGIDVFFIISCSR